MSATERSGRGVRGGLTLKIFAASTALIAVVLGGGFVFASARASRTAESAIDRQLAASQEAVDAQLRARTSTAVGMLRVITLVPAFRELLTRAETPRTSLLDQAEEHATTLGASYVMIVDRDGVLQARSDDPERYDEDLRGLASWVDSGLDEALATTGVTTSQDSIYQLAVVPIVEPASDVVYGVIAAAFSITESLAQGIKRTTGSEIVFWEIFEGVATVRASTVSTGDALDSVLASDELLAQLDADTAPARLDATIDDEHHVGIASPLRATHGEVYGGVAALRSRQAELAAFTGLQRTLALAAGAGILLSLVGSAAVARRIARPVRQLAAATERVQDGDYAVEIGEFGHDEIGSLARSFRSMLDDLREKQQLVDYLMSGTGGGATVPVPRPGTATAQALESRGRALSPGDLFAGRYEIRRLLGTGGMGVVYLSRDRELDEQVAIKTLRPEAIGADDALLDRFRQEIRLARRITHRNVVRTHDLGEIDGVYYITMEYVDGPTLKELIQKRGHLPSAVIVTIGKQLCRALEAAHEVGVIHRDIKPQNLVVEPNGFLKVMDFGIARLAVRQRPEEGLTEAGMAIGTPEYMAPEQLMGDEVDARTDLYAVGAVLFECATGSTPFSAPSLMALMAKHLEERPPSARKINPELSPVLAMVIGKAIARQPAERFQSADELYKALEQIAPAPAH